MARPQNSSTSKSERRRITSPKLQLAGTSLPSRHAKRVQSHTIWLDLLWHPGFTARLSPPPTSQCLDPDRCCSSRRAAPIAIARLERNSKAGRLTTPRRLLPVAPRRSSHVTKSSEKPNDFATLEWLRTAGLSSSTCAQTEAFEPIRCTRTIKNPWKIRKNLGPKQSKRVKTHQNPSKFHPNCLHHGSVVLGCRWRYRIEERRSLQLAQLRALFDPVLWAKTSQKRLSQASFEGFTVQLTGAKALFSLKIC